ncbi:MAG TPA: hypothetical protein VJA23_05285 [Candidatus Nanoarchaeia archaeon]|nr:hypothetical protein [Candidatus Nanoarchaeia archaeon]
MRTGKKSQVEITFNWIYLLIAGAVILLFFVGIVVKQKVVAEEQLASEVVEVMDTIFAGAGVSEKTKNFIDTSGLADYTLYFNCEIDSQGKSLSEFGIKEKGSSIQSRIEPIFSPQELKATKMVLWSLPYNFPFKVVDNLLVTSLNTKYFILNSQDKFFEEFLNAIQGFNVKDIPDLSFINPENNFQIRIIDLDGLFIKENQFVSDSLLPLEDDKVTALVFTGPNQITYYQKQGAQWKKMHPHPITIISIAKERDAAKYAAIFSANDQTYQCNMLKAFQRLQYLLEIYEKKAKEMNQYYLDNPGLGFSKDCPLYIQGPYSLEDGKETSLFIALDNLKNSLGACLIKPEFCSGLISPAQQLQQVNRDLGEKGDCLTLY